jgi:hypothetical protein
MPTDMAARRRGPITLFFESRRFRWAVILVTVPTVLYVASYAVLASLYNRGLLSRRLMAVTEWLRWPLSWLYANGLKPVRDALVWFSSLWGS